MRSFVALVSLGALGLVAAVPAQAATPTFGPPRTVVADQNQVWGIAAADASGDGRIDLAVARTTTAPADLISVFLGQGDGSFGAVPADQASGPQSEAVEFGDVNADGDTDIVVGSVTGVNVHLGAGQAGFGAGTPVFAAPQPYATGVAIGNVTGSPAPDIVASSYDNMNPQNVRVGRNNGDGTFTPVPTATPPLAGAGQRAIALGDLNGDGLNDAVIGAETPFGNVIVLIANGLASVFNPAVFINAGTNVQDVALGDLDRDGDLDVVSANRDSDNVTVLRNTGGTISFLANFPIGGTDPQALAIGDVDGDGLFDLAVGHLSGTNGQIAILPGRGDGTFDLAVTHVSTGGSASPSDVVLADFDADDRLDLAFSQTSTPAFAAVALNTTLFPPAIVTTGAATNVSTDFATLNGTMDDDNRRGFWRFEYGETTAYGSSTPEQVLPPHPDPQAPAANVGGLKPGTTYHFRLVGRTLAGGVVNGADATFTTAPTASTAIALSRATFNVKYTLGVAKGQIVVRGTAAADSRVTLRLLRVKGSKLTSVRNFNVGTIKAGAFTKRLKVPGTMLPGRFAIRAVGTSGPVPLVPSEVRSTLKAPAAGIVRQAFASSVRNGPPALRLPGRRTQVHATFVFTVQPKAKRGIVARWFLPNGRALPAVPKPNTKRVGSVISVRSGALQAGRWRCELRVKGKLVAVVRVRIG